MVILEAMIFIFLHLGQLPISLTYSGASKSKKCKIYQYKKNIIYSKLQYYFLIFLVNFCVLSLIYIILRVIQMFVFSPDRDSSPTAVCPSVCVSVRNGYLKKLRWAHQTSSSAKLFLSMLWLGKSYLQRRHSWNNARPRGRPRKCN